MRLALRPDGGRRGELESAPNSVGGALSDQHHARVGRLFKPGSDVDRVAGHERATFAGPPEDDLAGVDANAEGEALAKYLCEPALHAERGVECALGVVLLGSGHAEGSHDGVPDELLHGPARSFDLGRHRLVEAVEEEPRALRILLSAEFG